MAQNTENSQATQCENRFDITKIRTDNSGRLDRFLPTCGFSRKTILVYAIPNQVQLN
jgi:hypothetical protein